MYTIAHPHDEERYKKRSLTIALIFGALMIIMLLLPFLTYPVPPIGQEGILVNLGLVDFGQGDENAAAAAAPVADSPSEATSADAEVTPEPEPTPEPMEAVTPPPSPEPVRETPVKPVAPDPDLLRQQQSDFAMRERRASEKRAAEIAEARETAARQAESQRQAEAERQAEARRQAAAAEAERKAAAEAKARSLRDATGSLFNGNQGSGGGRGNTGKAGNQGDPNGDPNADRLTGISSGGAGQVGGGLGSRGVVSSPKLRDNSQRAGKVVISVCVDNTGRVTSAEYTQRGSTTSDAILTALARENARGYKFSPSSASSQCGSITYEFVVQ